MSDAIHQLTVCVSARKLYNYSLGSILLQGAFYLYLVGAALASAVFLLELRQGSLLRSKEKLVLHRLVSTQHVS